MFPNDTSYDMAIRNKLKDMDIELVINAGFYPGVGRETARSFHNKVIAVQPLRMTPQMRSSGRKSRKPRTDASTESAAPRAFTTRTTGETVFCASS